MKKQLEDLSVLALRQILRNNGIKITFVASYIDSDPSNLSRYFNKNYLPKKLRVKVLNFINDKNLY